MVTMSLLSFGVAVGCLGGSAMKLEVYSVIYPRSYFSNYVEIKGQHWICLTILRSYCEL